MEAYAHELRHQRNSYQRRVHIFVKPVALPMNAGMLVAEPILLFSSVAVIGSRGSRRGGLASCKFQQAANAPTCSLKCMLLRKSFKKDENETGLRVLPARGLSRNRNEATLALVDRDTWVSRRTDDKLLPT